MPYSDKAKGKANKRAWERRQERDNTPYWQRKKNSVSFKLKKKRNSQRKCKKRRDRLQVGYVRQLLHWPDAPIEIVEVKRLQIKLLRMVRR